MNCYSAYKIFICFSKHIKPNKGRYLEIGSLECKDLINKLEKGNKTIQLPTTSNRYDLIHNLTLVEAEQLHTRLTNLKMECKIVKIDYSKLL